MTYLFAGYALDSERRELRHSDRLVPVEPQVFDLLEYLIRHRNRVVSKHDIFEAIWHGRAVSESALTSRINAARSAIGDSGEEQCLIRTLRGKGLRFVGAVQELSMPVRSAAASATGELSQRLALPDRPSIAVLPFTNMSGDPEQQHFADGISEDIITALMLRRMMGDGGWSERTAVVNDNRRGVVYVAQRLRPGAVAGD